MLKVKRNLLTTDEVLLTTLYLGLYRLLDPLDPAVSAEPIELAEG